VRGEFCVASERLMLMHLIAAYRPHPLLSIQSHSLSLSLSLALLFSQALVRRRSFTAARISQVRRPSALLCVCVCVCVLRRNNASNNGRTETATWRRRQTQYEARSAGPPVGPSTRVGEREQFNASPIDTVYVLSEADFTNSRWLYHTDKINSSGKYSAAPYIRIALIRRKQAVKRQINYYNQNKTTK